MEWLGYLMEHSQIWPEMGRRGRQFVEEESDVGKLNKRLVRIYENLVTGRLPTGDR